MTPAGPRFALRSTLLLGIALLAACTTQQGIPGNNSPAGRDEPYGVNPPEAPLPDRPPTEQPPLITRPQQPPPGGFPKSLKESGAGPAVLSLARQAQDSGAAGKGDAALGQLERALRIEPRNAFVWQALADAHLQLQHADQAESAALKSNSLGHGNPWLEAVNWRLIANARQQTGDAAGARVASGHADELKARLSAGSP